MREMNRYEGEVYITKPGYLTESEVRLSAIDDYRLTDGGDLIVTSVNDDESIRQVWLFARGAWIRAKMVDVGAQTGDEPLEAV
jgi:hypothetical protein